MRGERGEGRGERGEGRGKRGEGRRVCKSVRGEGRRGLLRERECER